MANPFSDVIDAAEALGPRLRVDALEERELLPAMLGEVRTFCRAHVDGDRIDREGKLGADLLAEVAQRGWFGLTIAEEHGGAGLSLAAATSIVSELAGHNGSLGTCVGLHSGLALHAMLHLAAPELQQRFLPDVALGKRLAAFAATEPGAGSDISAVRTTLSEADGRLQLDGEKCYVTNGGLCGMLTVLARSPGLGGARAGHTLVVVDPSAPGVTRSAEERKMGLKGSSTITIHFEGVEIPRDQLLGEVSKGLEHAHEALCWGRTFMAAGCLGSTRAALEAVREHTATREQFGRPLVRFPLVRESLARCEAEVYAMQSTLRLVCALGDTGLGKLALPSTIVKVLASEGAWQVVDRCVQLMGGAGYIEDSGMARRLRDVRVTRIFEGANDVLRVSLASAAIAWPASKLAALNLSQLAPEALRSEAQAYDAELGRLVFALGELKKRYGFRLFEQQAVAADLADGIIALFAATAVLLRACGGDEPVATSRLAIRIQLDRARSALARTLVERDAEMQALLDEVGGG